MTLIQGILQVRQMRNEERKDKIAVVVGTITNDLRLLNLPKLKVSTSCCFSLKV